MNAPEKTRTTSARKPPGVMTLLKPYSSLVVLLIVFALFSNGLNLLLPKIIANGIDSYTHQRFSSKAIIEQFLAATFFVFVFTYLQTIIQTYTSERVARDIRSRLSNKISNLTYTALEQANPSKLLTNLTADVDSIKLFVSQAVVSTVSSIFIIVGVSVLLLTINWKLALAVIAVIPIIGITFFFVLKNVRKLFIKSREVMD